MLNDTTYCDNGKCKAREHCYRYLALQRAREYEKDQTTFWVFNYKDEMEKCGHYMNEHFYEEEVK